VLWPLGVLHKRDTQSGCNSPDNGLAALWRLVAAMKPMFADGSGRDGYILAAQRDFLESAKNCYTPCARKEPCPFKRGARGVVPVADPPYHFYQLFRPAGHCGAPTRSGPGAVESGPGLVTSLFFRNRPSPVVSCSASLFRTPPPPSSGHTREWLLRRFAA
jgi:hypothetical protein